MSTVMERLVERARLAYPGVISATVLGRPGYKIFEGRLYEDINDTEAKNFDCRNFNITVVGADPEKGHYIVRWGKPTEHVKGY